MAIPVKHHPTIQLYYISINHAKVVQLSKTNQTNEILPPLKALKPCLHAALGASEACSAGTAALVQWTVEALPSAFLPEVQVLAVGACATFHIGFLIFVLFHQSITVVHVLHATKLVQFQAAVSPGCTWIIRLKSLQSGVHCLSSCQGQGHKGQQKLHGHTVTGMRCFQRESWALRAYNLVMKLFALRKCVFRSGKGKNPE